MAAAGSGDELIVVPAAHHDLALLLELADRADDGLLRVVSREGLVRFQYETGTGARITAGLCAALGLICFASTSGTLYAMEPVE